MQFAPVSWLGLFYPAAPSHPVWRGSGAARPLMEHSVNRSIRVALQLRGSAGFDRRSHPLPEHANFKLGKSNSPHGGGESSLYAETKAMSNRVAARAASAGWRGGVLRRRNRGGRPTAALA